MYVQMYFHVEATNKTLFKEPAYCNEEFAYNFPEEFLDELLEMPNDNTDCAVVRYFKNYYAKNFVAEYTVEFISVNVYEVGGNGTPFLHREWRL